MATSKFSGLAIVLASSSAGAPVAGTELGPRAILDSDLLEDLRRHFEHVHVCDINQVLTDVVCVPDFDHAGMKRRRTVSKVTQSVHEFVYEHAQKGRLVLTLGGDHSNAIGTLTGVTRAINERFNHRPAVICVDAHVSINPPELSPSGNIHGMPLAFATGLASPQEEGVFDWIKDEYLIDMKKLVYIGTRDIDEGEKRLIEENKIKVFDMRDIQSHGIDRVATMALDYVGRETPIHLSCDIDALDPKWASSAGHLVPGGLSLEDADSIVRRIRGSGNLIAVDLVEVNPPINPNRLEQTIQSGRVLMKRALGFYR